MQRLGDAWAEVFAHNESAKVPDSILRQEMASRFPAKSRLSTIRRVSQMRSDYNKGRGMFRRAGPAGLTPERPTSLCYGPGIPGRRKRKGIKITLSKAV